MKERGLLFSAPMVLALLAGRKTQTRRVVKPGGFVLPSYGDGWVYNGSALVLEEVGGTSIHPLPNCPYGVPGDRLWVKETCYEGTHSGGRPWVRYRADGADQLPSGTRWRSSIHMHRWASRIALEITDVRVQRLRDITDDDCRAEGMDGRHLTGGVRDAFWVTWEHIHGEHSWEINPYVWALTFKVVQP